MKILILDKDYPFPQDSGAKVRSFNLIKALSENHKLSILCFNKRNTVPSKDEEKYFSNIWMINCQNNTEYRNSNWIKRLLYILKGMPWEISTAYSNSFHNEFIRIIKEQDFDVIFARYIHLGQYILRSEKLIHARTILDLDDIEFIKVSRIIETLKKVSFYYRFRMHFNNWILMRYHLRIKIFSNVIVCSEKDRKYLEDKGFTRNAVVIPNTIDVLSYGSIKPFSNNVLHNKTLLFCGHLGYDPNSDGIIWFIENIFPLIRRNEQNVKLHVVGLRPPKEIMKFQDHKHIFVFPNVPDVKPYYDTCSAVIVPIRIAGGTRIKILEAFACLRPVISTAIGAEGLNVINNKHCLIANTPEEFASACLNVFNNNAHSNRLVENSYHLVQEQYDKLRVSKLTRDLINQKIT